MPADAFVDTDRVVDSAGNHGAARKYGVEGEMVCGISASGCAISGGRWGVESRGREAGVAGGGARNARPPPFNTNKLTPEDQNQDDDDDDRADSDIHDALSLY
jgi:hypothetical protein